MNHKSITATADNLIHGARRIKKAVRGLRAFEGDPEGEEVARNILTKAVDGVRVQVNQLLEETSGE